MEKSLLCSVQSRLLLPWLEVTWGRCEQEADHTLRCPIFLHNLALWKAPWHGTEVSRVSEKDFLRPAGQRRHPGPPNGPLGADPSQGSIHHFYVYIQIPNKEVIILPSLYHTFCELVRRLII